MSASATPLRLDVGRLKRSCSNCALHQLCLPAAIGGDDLERLDGIVKSRGPLERGELLFSAGQKFASLYVVRSGSFKTFTESEQGNVQVLGFHLPGEIIGFDALAENQHRCSAEALEKSTLCEVPFSQLEQVAARVPGLQHQLLRVISREVVSDHAHLVMMGRKQAQERLAIFLTSLADRRKSLGFPVDVLTLSMSRYDLANYLGLVVETVSRLFTRMAELGVLEVNRKNVRVLDAQRLHTMTGEGGDNTEPCVPVSGKA